MDMLNEAENEFRLILEVNDYKITNLSLGLSKLNSENVKLAYNFHIYYYITKLFKEFYNNYFCSLYEISVVTARFLNVFKFGKLFEEYKNMTLIFFWGVYD